MIVSLTTREGKILTGIEVFAVEHLGDRTALISLTFRGKKYLEKVLDDLHIQHWDTKDCQYFYGIEIDSQHIQYANILRL